MSTKQPIRSQSSEKTTAKQWLWFIGLYLAGLGATSLFVYSLRSILF